MQHQTPIWSFWVTQIIRLAWVWFALVVVLQGFRLHLLWEYADGLHENTATSDIVAALWMGFRFDSSIAGVLLLLPFFVVSIYTLLSCFCLSNSQQVSGRTQAMTARFVKVFVRCLCLLAIVLCVLNIPFYEEYDESYNAFVFEVFYDDPVAIAKTAAQQSQPFFYGLLTLWILLLFGRGLYWIEHYTPKGLIRFTVTKQVLKSFLIVGVLLGLVIACRGSIDQRPVMKKWASVTPDARLNTLIINPIRSLHYAYDEYRVLHSPSSSNPFAESVELPTLDSLMVAAPGVEQSPDHIVLVVMESYDAWPLMPKYQFLGLSNKVAEIADQGVHFKNFLPSANSTMNSLASLISGIGYTGINHSRHLLHQGGSPFSLFTNVQLLGYETFFFYGGFLSWQDVGDFVRSQGVQHVFSAPDAGGQSPAGVWGVDDDQLFELVLNTVPKNKKTFSVVLTSSYHGPYTVDVDQKGFPYQQVSDVPKPTGAGDPVNLDSTDNHPSSLWDQRSMSLKEMGHLWFADQAVGEFVEAFERDFNNPMVALTGDHYGRRFLNTKPSLEESSLVPFIIYPAHWINSSSVDSNPGTHIDITPTLLDLVAPKGFHYASLGQSLLRKSSEELSFGHQRVLLDGKLWSVEALNSKKLNSTQAEHQTGLIEVIDQYQQHKALHWALSFNPGIQALISANESHGD